MEIGSPVHFFHSQHLLYGFFGFLFWKLITLFSHQFRALPALQIFTSILSALGLLGIHTLLRRRVSELIALFTTLLVAFCAVTWVWSLEVQVYPLGFCALAFATATLLNDPPSPATFRAVGLWHALAVLGHVINLLWLVPATFWIFQETRTRDYSFKRAWQNYLPCLSLGIVLPYVIVIAGIAWPALHAIPESFAIWMRGSAGLSADHGFAWHWPGWHAPLVWGWTSLRFFWGALWPYTHGGTHTTVWATTALSIAGLVALFFSATRSPHRTLLQFALLWIAVYALFFWTWEPATECYRLTDAIPVAILIAVGAEALRPGLRWGVLATTLAATFTANFASRIYAMHNPHKNLVFAQTMALQRATEPDSMYLVSGSTLWLYLLYFTGRPSWDVQSPSAQRVLRAVETFHGQRHVYVDQALLADPVIGQWLKQFRLQRVSADLPWLKLL